MKDLIVTIAQALVDNPEEVEVSEHSDEVGLQFELKVAQADIGKVIGKKGRTAQAMRTLLAASAMREGKKAMLKIME